MSRSPYQECIDACRQCVTICYQCARFSCLLEDDVKSMARCVQLDLECAVLCNAAAQVMSLNGELSNKCCASSAKASATIVRRNAKIIPKWNTAASALRPAATALKFAPIWSSMPRFTHLFIRKYTA